MQSVVNLINHYGYIVIFVALMLELIAFPTPGEALMTYSGFLVFQGKLNWVISIIIATSGVALGITISYFVGRTLGFSFFKKYGHYIHLGPEKLEKTSKWFEKYGDRLLVVAFFIPGVRHITGYFSGITKIPFKRFAINAYIGAFIWTGTFISLGKVLGPNWEKFHSSIKKYLIIGGAIIALAMVLVFLYRSYKVQIMDSVIELLSSAMKIFRSFGRAKALLAGVIIAFLGLFALVIGLIQDYLAHEFNQFDMVVSFIVKSIFTQEWTYSMRLFGFIASVELLMPMIMLTLAWIIARGRERFLEIRFLIITTVGGEVLEEILRFAFHRLGPSGLSIIGNIKYTFPSEQSLMTVIVYGFTTFMLIRHAKKAWVGAIATIITIVLCIFSGLNPLFFQNQYPSDVVAGYAFGGVWLSLNIILLEVYRILPKIYY